ncbi:MAG: tetratricopeptide repeat protein [Acidobacteriota bacterium]
MLFLALFVVLLAADLTGVERDLAARRYSSALSGLREIPPDARTASWHLLASKACDGLDDVPEAVKHAEAAIRLDPASEPAYLQLAQIFLTRNTPEAAAEILTDAAPLFPRSPLIRLGLGLALKDLRRYDEAAAALRAALVLKPGLGTAFDALGTVFLEAGKYPELSEAAAGYIDRNPRDYRGYYYLAAGKLKTGARVGEAEQLLNRCIGLNPGFAAGHALLGKVLLDAGQVAPAIQELERAIRLRPDYTPAHLSLASAYAQAGRKEDARREAAELARLNEEQARPAPHLRYHRGTPQANPVHQ